MDLAPLPADFLKLVDSYPIELFGRIEHDLNTPPSVAVRVNPLKNVMASAGLKPVDWCDCGYYLSERLPFTFDPSLHQGLYYVQDPSSMVIKSIVQQLTSHHTPVVYLDACAAPGGKTTAAISALPAGSLVVANEYEHRRVDILRENLAKWGYPASVVTEGETSQFSSLRGLFDIVAIDAPCSGEGMFRKDDLARRQWSLTLVEQCAARQRQIIKNLIPALAEDGYLIYSTCTFNRFENEQIVEWACREYGLTTERIDTLELCGIDHGVLTDCRCYRFIPGRVAGEGLFVAVMRRTEKSASRGDKCRSRSDRRRTKIDGKLKNVVADWLNGEFSIDVDKNEIYAVPARWSAEIADISSKVKTVAKGVEVGEIKGRDIVPSQMLALSTAFNSEIFPTVEVDFGQAIAYLQRQTLSLPEQSPRGYVLLKHKGRSLGFVKNLGNRANNLYPSSWRILSTHIPAGVKSPIAING